MSTDESSIAFKPDYELDPEGPAKRYSVLDVNGNKEQFTASACGMEKAWSSS